MSVEQKIDSSNSSSATQHPIKLQKWVVIPIVCIVTLFPFLTLSSLDSPKEPTPPIPPALSTDGERDTRGEKKESEGIELSVLLCDGSSVNGKWKNPFSMLVFQHEKDGIQYRKNLQASDIAFVRILTWKKVFSKEKKEGKAYKLEPYAILIETKTGISFRKRGLDSENLRQIQLENEMGETTLYAYWMDLQFANGKWFSGMPNSDQEETSQCHPKVIREVQFR